MDREVLVYADLQGTPHFVGRLWSRTRKDQESATFEYDKSWLAHSERFSLEPALKLGPGPFHTASGKPLFGAIGDSVVTGGGAFSCAVPNAAARNGNGRRRAHCGKSIICFLWTMRRARVHCDLRKGKMGRSLRKPPLTRSRH